MKIIIIAAMDKNRVIGYKNSIPWHIPEDLLHFKKITMGHGIIMGRKTFESIACALPGRKNVVLSTNSALVIAGCHMAQNLAEGLQHCRNQEKTFIIGGETVYREAISFADSILLSVIPQEYTGDVFFPPIPEKDFELQSKEKIDAGQVFTIQTYRRK
jgi:dihydrofolate reductase